MLIYLAGAISAPNHFEFLRNIALALDFGRRLIRLGYQVYIPHLDFLLLLDSNKDHTPNIDDLYNNSFEIMKRCDEIWVLPNSENSVGVQKEINWWIENGKIDKIIYLSKQEGE